MGWAGPEAGSRQGSHVWPGPGSGSHGSSPPSKGSWAPGQAAILGLWALRPQTRPGRQEIAGSGPERPPSGPSLPPASQSGLGLLRPAPMGLTLSLSLSAPSCFPSEAENGSLVTNMASGHWVMCASSPGCSTKGPFVPLPAPLSGSSPAPHTPTRSDSLLPAPPALHGTPGPPGVTVAWPWRPPSPGAPRAGAGPGGRGDRLAGGQVASGRPRGAEYGVPGAPCKFLCAPPVPGREPSAPHPRPLPCLETSCPSHPPSRSNSTAASGWE